MDKLISENNRMNDEVEKRAREEEEGERREKRMRIQRNTGGSTRECGQSNGHGPSLGPEMGGDKVG